MLSPVPLSWWYSSTTEKNKLHQPRVSSYEVRPHQTWCTNLRWVTDYHHELKRHKYKSPASSIFQIVNTLQEYISFSISLLAPKWQRNDLSGSTGLAEVVFNSMTFLIKFYKLISRHYIKTFNWTDNFNEWVHLTAIIHGASSISI
jgi:hypothetical protein